MHIQVGDVSLRDYSQIGAVTKLQENFLECELIDQDISHPSQIP